MVVLGDGGRGVSGFFYVDKAEGLQAGNHLVGIQVWERRREGRGEASDHRNAVFAPLGD